MAKDSVSHRGRIVGMDPQWTTVQFEAQSACSSCHAAGLCGMSEMTEKTVQVAPDPYASYQVGDEVEVVLKASMGIKAVWIAYMVPLLALLAVFFGATALGASELAAGLAGIASLAVYYLVVWLLRDRLQNEYVFTIKH